jgi:hypothetical protein
MTMESVKRKSAAEELSGHPTDASARLRAQPAIFYYKLRGKPARLEWESSTKMLYCAQNFPEGPFEVAYNSDPIIHDAAEAATLCVFYSISPSTYRDMTSQFSRSYP